VRVAFTVLLLTSLNCTAYAGLVDDALRAVHIRNAPVEPECLDQVVGVKRADEVSCRALSEAYCRALWLNKNPGNYDGDGVAFRLGKSKTGAISETKKIDLEALIEAQRKLAVSDNEEDAKIGAKLRGPIGRLKLVLKRESDTDAWREELSNSEERIESALGELAKGKAAELEDQSEVLEEYNQARELEKIKDRITDAKYASHPNWLRTKRVFAMAKEDVLAEIDSLPYSVEQRTKIRKVVSEIELNLPARSQEKYGMPDPCSDPTVVNAQYNFFVNNVTVCPGLFNSFQGDATIYSVLAHEIGHAFDPGVLADRQRHDSVSGKMLEKLVEKNGDAFSCEDWEKQKRELKTRAKAIDREEFRVPLSKLLGCLTERPREAYIKRPKDLNYAAHADWALVVTGWAEGNWFSHFLSPEWNEGKNPFLNNPAGFTTFAMGGIPSRVHSNFSSGSVLYVFQQERICRNRANMPLTTADFHSVMRETGDVLKAIQKEQQKVCGKYCAHGEFFADWISTRAFTRYLKRVPKEKRAFAAFQAFGVDYCSGDQQKLAREILRGESSFRGDDHPAGFRRIESTYTWETRRLVGCSLGDDDSPEYGDCQP
jgi:hypothetical protein